MIQAARTDSVPRAGILCVVVSLAYMTTVAAATESEQGSTSNLAQQILKATGVTGGVIVHVGCGDGQLTAALHASDSYLVEGLETDSGRVDAARKNIQALGLYGKVSVQQWSGKGLPYIGNSVNLLVSESPISISNDEILRVLVPDGVAYVKSGGTWAKTVKPRPKEMDEWTHYLHDSTNNAVAHDSLIAPPAHYQWVGSDRYARQHDHMSSVNAAVTANGRFFTIFDEAPRASILTPPDWRLIARDAFNGTLLWKRDIGAWHNHLWPLKKGPQLMTRRLVAVGDRVYVTLCVDGPLMALDAATGKTVRTYEGTKATEEILCDAGVLFLSVAADGQPLRSDPRRRYANLDEIKADVNNPLWTDAPRTIVAVDAESGKLLWNKVSTVVSESLCADQSRVLFHDGQRIQCLDRNNGKVLWESEPLARRSGMSSSSGITLVSYDDVILYSGMIAVEKYAERRDSTMFALSAKDGKTLWKAAHPYCGHQGTPDDILVAGGLVWIGAAARAADSGIMSGRDPHTGDVKIEFPCDAETHWFHHRCHRAKATDNYLLYSRTGIEFIDFAKEHWICHHWVRGACLYGIMPANGLIYAPPHPCACYIEAKLDGFTALAPASQDAMPRGDVPDSERLQRGPAYGEPISGSPSSEDWPTFRHDAARSGGTKTAVQPTGLKQRWTAELGGKLSSPVVADGKLLVASIDAHDVHALDSSTGKVLWTFTAGGRVDSPPTIWQGHAMFGSADGYVYCLRASDGQLVWRYRVAPEERRMGAFEQVESVWPVSGSVLVQDETVYCVAGRSMFLDGGLRLVRLDPKTGRKLSETIMDDQDPLQGKNLQVHIEGLNMPVGLPDVLSCDGKYVYMRSLPFELEGSRKFVAYVPVDEQQGDDVHLFSPTGFLDDTLWHRTYWVYGRAFASGAGGYSKAGRLVPAGRILVFDDENIYGYGRQQQYYRWTTPLEFELFSVRKLPVVINAGTERKPVTQGGERTDTVKKLPVTRFEPSWSDHTSVQTTALVLTDEALFAAGVPDVADEEQSAKTLSDPETQNNLAEQGAAFEGLRGGLLVAVSPTDGKRLAAYRLDSMPRFDGLIAAGGQLYMTTTNGKVVCLSTAQGKPLAAAPEVVADARPVVAIGQKSAADPRQKGTRKRKANAGPESSAKEKQ